MKTKTIKLSSALALSLLVWGCGNNNSSENKNDSNEHQHSESTETSVNPSLINLVVQHYVHLKNALVAANLSEAKAAAKGILDAINSTDTTAFSTEQKATWHEQIGKVKENAKRIAEAPEVLHQREYLGSLTEGMYNLIKVFGGGKVLYYDFCPMANNNNGGYWLSENEDIKNPYFGDEMLECGRVKETLK